MGNYYEDKLNAQKLYQVYDTDIPRVKLYLTRRSTTYAKN